MSVFWCQNWENMHCPRAPCLSTFQVGSYTRVSILVYPERRWDVSVYLCISLFYPIFSTELLYSLYLYSLSFSLPLVRLLNHFFPLLIQSFLVSPPQGPYHLLSHKTAFGECNKADDISIYGYKGSACGNIEYSMFMNLFWYLKEILPFTLTCILFLY